MTSDMIADGEALSEACEDAGADVTPLRGTELTGPDLMALQETRFRAYQNAFHRNAGDPSLANAAALVQAFNEFAEAMGLGRV